jgi:hypothetical protein
LVLTDHSGPFANKYYHSQFDSAGNLLSDLIPGSAQPAHTILCRKATLLARTLWIEAGGDPSLATMQADCTMMDQLLRCMLEDSTCDLVQSVDPSAYPTPNPNQGLGNTVLSHYSSVFTLAPESYISGDTLFLHDLMYPWVLNASGWIPPPKGYDGPWPTAPRNIHVHDAVDPNLVFDLDANRYDIKSTANDFPLWAESNWDSTVGFRTFRVEDPRVEVGFFVAGLVVAVLVVLGVGGAQKYCQRRFKTLQTG